MSFSMRASALAVFAAAGVSFGAAPVAGATELLIGTGSPAGV
jgi:hypothetical protein